MVPTTAVASNDVVRGTADTRSTVEGSADGRFEYADSVIDWFPRDLPSSATEILRGATVRVSVKGETKTTAMAAGKDAYTHRDGDTRFVKEYHDATLLLQAGAPAAHVAVACLGAATSNVRGDFLILPPTPVADQSVGAADARSRFTVWRAGDIQLQHLAGRVHAEGDLSLLFENATFAVRDASGQESYAASYDEDLPGNPAGRRTTLTLYFVEVTGGRLDTMDVDGALRARSERLAADLVGTMTFVAVTGQAATPNGALELHDERVDLQGRLDATLTAGQDDSSQLMQVRFQQQATRLGALGSAAASNVHSAAWALPLSLGGVLALVGIGATALGPLRASRRRAPPPVSEAPAAVVEPPSLIALAEQAYRADPGNIQRAMELALHYANAQRYQDALPLLLMTVTHFPKSDVARYATALALLQSDRVEEAVRHLDYAFRLNPLNVARFLKEGPAVAHGKKPAVQELLSRWARVWTESNSRGYA